MPLEWPRRRHALNIATAAAVRWEPFSFLAFLSFFFQTLFSFSLATMSLILNFLTLKYNIDYIWDSLIFEPYFLHQRRHRLFHYRPRSFSLNTRGWVSSFSLRILIRDRHNIRRHCHYATIFAAEYATRSIKILFKILIISLFFWRAFIVEKPFTICFSPSHNFEPVYFRVIRHTDASHGEEPPHTLFADITHTQPLMIFESHHHYHAGHWPLSSNIAARHAVSLLSLLLFKRRHAEVYMMLWDITITPHCFSFLYRHLLTTWIAFLLQDYIFIIWLSPLASPPPPLFHLRLSELFINRIFTIRGHDREEIDRH